MAGSVLEDKGGDEIRACCGFHSKKEKDVRTLLTILSIALISPVMLKAQPVANAGGTYNIDQSNGSDLMLNGSGSTAPSGHTLSYSWSFVGYYIGNDKVTHQTGMNGESVLAQIVCPTCVMPQVIGMKMFCGDSIHLLKFAETITDNTTLLTSTDTAFVFYRYWNKYPPQNTGDHVATSGDCAALPANMQPACTVGLDWFITGANDDPVKDASGVSHFTSFFQSSSGTGGARPAGNGGRVWVNAGNSTNGPYCNFQQLYDTTGGSGKAPLGDTTKPQIIETFYCSASLPTNLKGLAGFTFQNISNVRITGDYDPVNHIGISQYPNVHNGYAYSDTLYGWMVNNHYQSRAGASFQISGKDSHHWRIDHCASINGNFFGFQLKQEYAGLANSGTRPQVYWYSDSCDDNLVKANTGEAFYCFSANSPAIQGVHFRFFNNRSLYAGNKSFKVLDQYQDNWVYNNAAAFISINWASAFEEGVSVGSEVSVVGSGNRWFNNLIYRYGNQGLNYLSTVGSASGVVDSITNNAFPGGVGPIGFYYGQQDSAITLYLTRNITGGYTQFLFGQAYSAGGYGTNTQFQIQALQAGSLPVGITHSTLNITNHYCDSTKTTVYSGQSIANIVGTTQVHQIPWPNFANSGFAAGTNIRQWNSITFGTFGDEFGRQSDQKNTAVSYAIGEVVHWFGKFYQSNINSNTAIPTGATDANWTLLTFSNGGTDPPNDIRLLSTDFYAQRGIGLFDQVLVNLPLNFLTIPRRVILH